MKQDVTIKTDAGDITAYTNTPDGEIKGGLIVIHEVWDLPDHIKSVADRFAEERYLVLAPSLLGEINITPEVSKELQEGLFNPVDEVRNKIQPKLRELMAPMQAPDFGDKTVTRLKASFDYLMGKPEVKEKIGVVGFCFGG